MRAATVLGDVPATHAPTNRLELHRKVHFSKAYAAWAARQGVARPGIPPAPAPTLVADDLSEHPDVSENDLNSLQKVINQVRVRLTEVEAQLDHASSLLQERNLQTTAEAQLNLSKLQQQLSMETWVHDQYLQTLCDTCKPSKDQADRICSSLERLNTWTVRKAAYVEKLELQMVCGQLHFNAQTAQAKLAVMMNKYNTLLADHQLAKKLMRVLREHQKGRQLVGQQQEAVVQCDLAAATDCSEACVQCDLISCSYSDDQITDIMSKLKTSEQRVDMLKMNMAKMTRLAEVLVGFSLEKYALIQQQGPDLHQHTSELDIKAHSPQTYQPAVEVAAQQHDPPVKQQCVMADQHALAVVAHPADTTSMPRWCNTESSGDAWDYTSVIETPRQQGYKDVSQAVQNPAVQQSLESLAGHNLAAQLSLKSLVVQVPAVQQNLVVQARQGAAVQCGLGTFAGQDLAVQFNFATQARQDAAAQCHLGTELVSDETEVQEQVGDACNPCDLGPHAHNGKLEAQHADSEAGSSTGLHIPALAATPAVIQDWLRMQLISLAKEESNLLQASSVGVSAGAGTGAAVGDGSGATVGLTASAEEMAVLAWLRSSMVSLRASGAAGITDGVQLGSEGPVTIQAAEQSHGGRRFSCTKDEELAPVASDLMLRLSETNSTLKAREAEVASLQAQNTLLRQQVEQQQQQLDAVGYSVQECEGGKAWWVGVEQ